MLTFSGTMPQVRAAVAIPHKLYTNVDLVLVGLASSAPFMALATLVSTTWRFPVPFFWVLFAMPWLVCVIIGNAVVLRGRLHRIGRPLLGYVPSLTVQVAQIIIYPAYSALFEAASDTGQIMLIVMFPLLKVAIRKGVFALTRSSNREFSSEIAVSSVEICSSMYQSIIMQTTPSVLATVLLIAIDVVQGAIAIRRFMRHGSTLTRMDIVTTMGRLAEGARQPIIVTDHELSDYSTRKAVLWPAATKLPRLLRATTQVIAVTPVADSNPHKRELTQTLELFQSAETILLVEYLEVAVPLVNAVYLAFASQFTTAVYNPRLRDFHRNPRDLAAAVASVMLYTSLQALTLVATALALQHRLKLSALALLAFVLETHAWSLQGKLIPWLSVFLVFPIAHFGVDFTFKFDFATLPSG